VIDRAKTSARAGAAGIFILLFAPALFGQAWIAPRGETTVSLTYERTEHEGHYLKDGTRVRVGASHASALSFDVEHSLTDRLAVSAGIPYVASSNGPDPSLACLCRSGIDDGKYHATWQDFRFGLRFNILANPVALTPMITVRVPSHHYDTAFEAAPGRHLRETILGIAAGRTFAPGDHPISVSGQYTYALVEKVLGVSTNRSNADLDVGYYPTPSINVHTFVDWQRTNGGVTTDFVLNFDNRVTHPELYQLHDGLLRDRYWRAGVGAGYNLTERTNVFASIATALAGNDSHYGYFYIVGVVRSFNGAR
jgi:hypothetical protein